MTERTCVVEDCATPRRYREHCQRHYDQLKRDRAERNALRARQRAERPEVTRAYNEWYYAAHKAENVARCREWRELNRERHYTNRKRWALANPEKERQISSARHARRYARIKATQVKPVDFAAILERFGFVCHICGGVIPGRFDLQFDHVRPLAKGGSHTEDNIKPSHAVCNQRKGARWDASSDSGHAVAAD